MTHPSSWIQTNLGTLIELSTGKLDANAAVENGEYPFFTCSEKPSQINTYAFDTDAVLLAGNGSFGVKHYKGKFNAYQRTYVIEALGISSRFLFWLIKANIHLITENERGSTIPYIRKGDITDIDISLPPLNEQIRIADKLDSVLAKVDAAQARLEKIPTLLKRFRQSVLAAATSGELTREWRGDTEFGKTVSIGELTSDIRYGTSKKCFYGEGNTAVLRIPNIGDGKIDTSDLKFADFDKVEKEKLILKKGDILIIRSNGSVDLVGKAALVSDKDTNYLYAGYLIRIRFKDEFKVEPKYVLFCLQSPSMRHVVELNVRSTSGINNINSKELASLELELPNLVEQTEIVRRVESLFAQADAVEKQYLAAKQRLDRLSQSLLAKAFRGELVPQDPNDEPAAELLKRIQAERDAQAPSKRQRKPA